MEEIKVREYVRLARNQGIRKIEEIDEEGYWLDDYIADEFGEATLYLYKAELKDEVENHSSNIIDLIEVGDYVNELKVTGIMSGYVYLDKFNRETRKIKTLADYQIENIVTKEQFASVEYKVKEN